MTKQDEGSGGRGSGARGAPGTGTSPARMARCRWCGRRFDVVQGPGRPRTYCRRSCRQRDYEARQRAADVGLADGLVVITRHDLDALHDRLYELESAVEDVDRDLAATEHPDGDDFREALEWLLATARPLTTLRLGERPA